MTWQTHRFAAFGLMTWQTHTLGFAEDLKFFILIVHFVAFMEGADKGNWIFPSTLAHGQ
jgi:hypothetical protein